MNGGYLSSQISFIFLTNNLYNQRRIATRKNKKIQNMKKIRKPKIFKYLVFLMKKIAEVHINI